MEIYILMGLASFFIFCLFYFGKRIYEDLKRERIIKNFSFYETAWNYYLAKAYNMIHKDKILIYSLEATTLPDHEFNEASKEFVLLTKKIMGPTLFKEFELFYGNYDTLLFNILEYFNTNYEFDEIRKGSMDSLMESDVEIQ